LSPPWRSLSRLGDTPPVFTHRNGRPALDEANDPNARPGPAISNRIAALGLGRFGGSIAIGLIRQDWEVVCIDADAAAVQTYTDQLTHTAVANTTDEVALRQLGVHEMTRAVVGIGTDLEAGILATALLADLGFPNIWAKAVNRQHARILERVGATTPCSPEHEMGEHPSLLLPTRFSQEP
jgi:trk system potassium uptake protein TrkA